MHIIRISANIYVIKTSNGNWFSVDRYLGNRWY